MAKFTLWAATDRVGSKDSVTVEIDDEDLEGYEGHERDWFIEKYMRDELHRVMEWGWKEEK